MTLRPVTALLTVIALAILSGCVDAQGAQSPKQPVETPRFLGIKTALLDGDLVNFNVAMSGVTDDRDIDAYARCAAAQYALIRGSGFARHVRTVVNKSGAVWSGDAVYIISSTLPRGELTIDAEVAVSDCAARAIPTV